MHWLIVFLGAWLMGVQPVQGASPPCQLTGNTPPVPAVALAPMAGGLTEPVGLTHAGDGSGRLFIIEQQGIIRIWKDGKLLAAPFLDLRRQVTAGGERGLLGLAFHPKFSTTGRLFVNYTSTARLSRKLQTIISEFRIGKQADRADPASERILLTVPQPYDNHNGGHIAFGPDGYLYIGLGDGGSGNDPHNYGQSLSTLLGKMLRIDVDRADRPNAYAIPPDNPFANTAGAAPEIWAYGFRNPWRYAFDPVTGRFYVGDVGQKAREEIDRVEKGKNYGWRIMEGTICTPGVNPSCDRKGLTPPILDYPRSEGISVIGGAVYRGRAIPGLCGVYLYGDFGSGRLWGLRDDGATVTGATLLLKTGRPISAFGEDEQYEFYVVDYGGEILKLVEAARPTPATP